MSGASRIADLTPEQLARLQERLRAMRGGAPAPKGISRRTEPGPAPLSFAQQRIWLHEQVEPDAAAFNLGLAVRLRGALDRPALTRSLGEIVRRHEVMRSTFFLAGESPVQLAHPESGVLLRTEEAPGGPRRDAAVLERARAEVAAPFDLSRDTPLRALLLREGPEEHVLVLTMHHIAVDKWSSAVLLGELGALYAAFSRGEPSPLPELPIQYADYAAWQRTRLTGEVLEEQLSFWKRHLDGAPTRLQLPSDFSPAEPGFTLARHPVRIAPALARALGELARGEGATPYTALLTAYVVLLSRWCGQDDLLVGCLIANRHHAGTAELLGTFVNVLALRARTGEGASFRELLRQLRDTLREAQAHQDLPFERLVEELRPPRDAGRNLLVQTALNLQLSPASGGRASGLEIEVLPVVGGTAGFDFYITLEEVEGGYAGVVEYNAELFAAETVARVAGAYGRILERMAADPDAPLEGVELPGEEERRWLAAFNDTGAPYPREATVHALFEAQAARTPERTALLFGEESLSYAALDGRAARLAGRLRALGVGPEARVGILLERSAEMVVAALAVLKAGGAYVPLDASFPAARLEWIARDAQLAAVLTQASLRALAPSAGGHVLVLDEAGAEDGAAAVREGGAEAGAQSSAYVLYTSGSTGAPKGVVVQHRSVVNFLVSMRSLLHPGAQDRLLSVTRLGFDISVLEIFLPLSVGAAVEVAGAEAVAEPRLLAERIRRGGATLMQATPATWQMLLDAGWEGAPGLRILCGGEALPAPLAERLRGCGEELWNLYGPTETTIWSAAQRVEALPGRGGAVELGRPIANTRLHVLDSRMRPVLPGAPGELYIAGEGLARGYLRRPSTTAERFVPDPCGGRPGARLYRTGDVVRSGGQDGLVFLGRTDHQVKVRGHRIEPGEVEAALAAHPGVAQAVVVARPDASGEKRLVGYVATVPGMSVGAEELRAHLGGRLPPYMVPSTLVLLAALPLTPNGKVDRGALPDPASAGARSAPYVEPSGEVERALAAMWADVLGVASIGAEDDFFALGGHSMLAVRLMAQVRRRFGVELPLSALFDHPTVRRLAPLLEGGSVQERWSPLVAIQPEGDRVPIFFVHPIGGQVLCYSELARHLGPDQPFYGLQAPDLVSLRGEEASIEEMAAQYVAAVREVWPHGPYLLGGWSFGGCVAFEMAQQLARAGEPVPVVALLDTASPEAVQQIARVEEPVRLAHLAREEAIKAGRRVTVTAEELRRLDPEARVVRVLEVLKGAGVASAEVEPDWVRRLLDGTGARLRSLARYRPEVFPGRIALFLPSEHDTEAESLAVWNDSSSLGWRAYSAEPAVVHVVPGYHATMATGAHAEGVAKRLRAVVDESLHAPALP